MPNLLQRYLSQLLVRPGAKDKTATFATAAQKREPIQAALRRYYKYRVELSLDSRRAAIVSAESPMRPDRRMLYSLYEQVCDDEHLSALWDTLVLSCAGEPIVLRNASGRLDDSELIALFQRPWFWSWVRLALDAHLWGHSLIELLPGDSGYEIRDAEIVPREHLLPEWGMLLIGQADHTGPLWSTLPQAPRLVEVGNRKSLGLLKKLSRAVVLKNFSLTDWARRNERYGQPFAGLKTASRDDKELDKKADMLANLGTNGWAIFDTEDDLEFHESSQAFAYQTFKDKTNLMDSYISKLILGQTMSSDDGSSLAQGQVHKEVMDERKRAYLVMLQAEVNMKLIPAMIGMGYPLDGMTFCWWHLTPEYEQEQEEKNTMKAATGEKKKP